jgi:nucleoside-triphosphatase
VKNVLLTGRPGVGKTTVVQAIVRLFPGEVGGFLTGEIRERGTRKGFSITSVEGESAVMAHVDFRSPVRVGKYGVDVPAFERIALLALHDAIQRKPIIVIDEVGKMELASRKFSEAVSEALSSGRFVVATIMQHRHPFADEIKALPDLEVFEVTTWSRDVLPRKIREMIEGQGGTKP